MRMKIIDSNSQIGVIIKWITNKNTTQDLKHKQKQIETKNG